MSNNSLNLEELDGRMAYGQGIITSQARRSHDNLLLQVMRLYASRLPPP